jgi:outer membrane lipoprotein LolB
VGRSIGAALLAVALAGCATVSPPPPPSPPSASASTGAAFAGRLAVTVEAVGESPPRAFSGGFDLRGDATRGTLALATPFGNAVAEARWQPAEVVLVTPRETRRYATIAALTRDALGESVPLEALFDWLQGRPWPNAASAPAERGFAQLGWRVDTSGLAEGRFAARRTAPEPAVEVRIRLDGS